MACIITNPHPFTRWRRSNQKYPQLLLDMSLRSECFLLVKILTVTIYGIPFGNLDLLLLLSELTVHGFYLSWLIRKVFSRNHSSEDLLLAISPFVQVFFSVASCSESHYPSGIFKIHRNVRRCHGSQCSHILYLIFQKVNSNYILTPVPLLFKIPIFFSFQAKIMMAYPQFSRPWRQVCKVRHFNKYMSG